MARYRSLLGSGYSGLADLMTVRSVSEVSLSLPSLKIGSLSEKINLLGAGRGDSFAWKKASAGLRETQQNEARPPIEQLPPQGHAERELCFMFSIFLGKGRGFDFRHQGCSQTIRMS
jgi:hypothetical protein